MELKLMIEKGLIWGLLLFPPSVVCWIVLHKLSFVFRRKAEKPAPVDAVTTGQYPVSQGEIEPATMTVREVKHSNGAEGSVIVRVRASKNAVTGMLIIWSGKNKKAKKRKGSDSIYDLGAIDGTAITDAIVSTMVAEAQRKLDELANPRKVVEQSADVPATVISLPVVDPAPVQVAVASPAAPATETSTVVTEDVGSKDPAIKLRRHPAIYRGEVVEVGVMERAIGRGIIDQFCVKYKTAEGVEDAVWGSDLKRALDDAKAKVGDYIEILKIGRKVVEEGKAPMNMYKVHKLSTPSASCQ